MCVTHFIDLIDLPDIPIRGQEHDIPKSTGIDDFRGSRIALLALNANADALKTALLNTDPKTTYVNSYSGGYMLLRYFAKQVADSANNEVVNGSPNIASIQDALVGFADVGVSDSLTGLQQEDKQNSSLFVTGNI